MVVLGLKNWGNLRNFGTLVRKRCFWKVKERIQRVSNFEERVKVDIIRMNDDIADLGRISGHRVLQLHMKIQSQLRKQRATEEKLILQDRAHDKVRLKGNKFKVKMGICGFQKNMMTVRLSVQRSILTVIRQKYDSS